MLTFLHIVNAPIYCKFSLTHATYAPEGQVGFLIFNVEAR